MQTLRWVFGLALVGCGSTSPSGPTRDELADCWVLESPPPPIIYSQFTNITWAGMALQTDIGDQLVVLGIDSAAGSPRYRNITRWDMGHGLFGDSLSFYFRSSLVGEMHPGRYLPPDIIEIDMEPTGNLRYYGFNGLFRFRRQHQAPNAFGLFVCVVPSTP